MKPIRKEDRLVANIYKDQFSTLPDSAGKDIGQSVLQLNTEVEPGVGFHVYKMAPGMTTEAHVHTSHEEFFVLEGDITDNDGTQYVAGDLVLLKAGTEHNSSTKNGCTLLVYIPTAEEPTN
ncbi:MAG: cupin domain-containing protein [Pseudomonadota bacterium]